MESEYKIENLIKIIIIVLLIAGIFYGLTILITKNKKNTSSSTGNTTNTDIQYTEILLGSLYNQKENEYYVLVETESDYLTLSSIVNTYHKKAEAIKLYISNLDDAMNKKYKGETSNFENQYPTFSKSTLLKIANGEIVEHIEGTSDIQKKLAE